MVSTIAVGSVMVKEEVEIHPFASVTVQVYEPATNPLSVMPVPPVGVQ